MSLLTRCHAIVLFIAVFISSSSWSSGIDLANSISASQSTQKATKLSNELSNLVAGSGSKKGMSRGMPLVPVKDGLVAIEVLISGDMDVNAKELVNMGMQQLIVTTTSISGYLPIAELESLERMSSVKAVRHHKAYTKNGAVISQGVQAMQSSDIQAEFNVTGKGVLVGVISDSYNCLGGEQADIASGDIPQGVQVIAELDGCSNATDEGRALIQVIHDIAADAKFVFGSGFGLGSASISELIASMVETHQVDIIVDDTGLYYETFFQDDAIGVAIKKATDMGVSYISAAGNGGTYSYEGLFASAYDPILKIMAHDFDSGEGVSIFQKITIPSGEGINLIMQWDEPAYSVSGGEGARSDLDLFLLNENGSEVLASAAINNLGADPVEILEYFNMEEFAQTQFQLLIVHAQGRSPGLVKYYIPTKFSGSIDSYSTNSSTIVGRANTESAISVGATRYSRTRQFGNPVDEVTDFSSAGGTPILFDQLGRRISDEYRVRNKPDVTAPDGVNTTFFGDEDTEADGFPNFFGTSASAPHVAGIVALMLEAAPDLSPLTIQHLLRQSASDITSSATEDDLPEGFDFRSGYGLVQGNEAVRQALAWPVGELPILKENQSYILFDGLSLASSNSSDNSQVQGRVITGSGSLSWQSLYLLLLFYLCVCGRAYAFGSIKIGTRQADYL